MSGLQHLHVSSLLVQFGWDQTFVIDCVLQRHNLPVNTLCHVIQHAKTTQSPCVGPSFTFKQLTPWSFSRRKSRLSKFTKAYWAHRHTGNGKRFHRHGHMTRAGSVDGSGETGGERLEWCVSAARVVYSSMRHTKPSLLFYLPPASFCSKCCLWFPPCMRPAFWLAAVVTVYSRYLDSWKLRERPEPLELPLQRWSHCRADCSHKQHLFC